MVVDVARTLDINALAYYASTVSRVLIFLPTLVISALCRLDWAKQLSLLRPDAELVSWCLSVCLCVYTSYGDFASLVCLRGFRQSLAALLQLQSYLDLSKYKNEMLTSCLPWCLSYRQPLESLVSLKSGTITILTGWLRCLGDCWKSHVTALLVCLPAVWFSNTDDEIICF